VKGFGGVAQTYNILVKRANGFKGDTKICLKTGKRLLTRNLFRVLSSEI
jgi:hypothetical protein